jgi:hypothetical protein
MFSRFEDEFEVCVEMLSGGMEISHYNPQHVVLLELGGTAIALVAVFDFGGYLPCESIRDVTTQILSLESNNSVLN